jgi:hypothetical protein
MSRVGDALVRAIEVLDTKGWCKYTVEDQSGKRCAYGAYALDVGDWMLSYRISDALWNHLPEEFKTGNAWEGVRNGADCHVGRVVAFNNHDDTTYRDVRALFEKAALNEGVTL